MYQVLVLAVMNALFFGLTLLAAKRHKVRRDSSKEVGDKYQMSTKNTKPMVEGSNKSDDTAKREEEIL